MLYKTEILTAGNSKDRRNDTGKMFMLSGVTAAAPEGVEELHSHILTLNS
jgi:hypothetical protein